MKQVLFNVIRFYLLKKKSKFYPAFFAENICILILIFLPLHPHYAKWHINHKP
jgi:hypothetical protein